MSRWLKLIVAVVAVVAVWLCTATTTASAATFAYDVPTIASVHVHLAGGDDVAESEFTAAREGSVSLAADARGTSTTLTAPVVATEAATSRTFGIADRVAGKLDDVRLGSLRGQLGPDDLQRLVNAPGAQRYYDTATGNINVIQQVDDVLLRITTASDEFKIISVGPIRPNQVTNGVTNGRFVPIGGAG